MHSHSTDWPSPPPGLTLAAGEVHVWRADLVVEPSQLRACARCLDGEERARASRFRLAQHRERFIAAHGWLRAILARYLRVSPAAVALERDANGKPQLRGLDVVHAVQFNLSHSHDLALIAVALDRPVGVDVEFIRPDTTVMQIADRFFAARESAALRELPGPQQRRAFFDTWTRKEAWLKARGVGLGGALDQCVDDQADWLVQELSVGPNYSAALAVGGADVTLRCWQASAVTEGSGELV